jgi:hypothetical protein
LNKLKLITLCASILLLLSCVTTLKQVKEDPQNYVGKVIRIHGDITKVQKIPLTDFSLLIFKDTEDISAVVFTSKERKEGHGISLKGKVLAVEEDTVNDRSSAAVNGLTDFLIEHKFAERDKAENISSAVIKIVHTLSKGIGSFFFIIEE